MMQPSLDDLRRGIDACWQKKSDIAKLFCLKAVLSDIHNTMTSLATEAFIEWMDTHRQVLGLDKSDIADTRERANQKSVNSNGFDIAVSGKLYAEVVLDETERYIAVYFFQQRRNGFFHRFVLKF